MYWSVLCRTAKSPFYRPDHWYLLVPIAAFLRGFERDDLFLLIVFEAGHFLFGGKLFLFPICFASSLFLAVALVFAPWPAPHCVCILAPFSVRLVSHRAHQLMVFLCMSPSLRQWSARGRRGWSGFTRSISFLRRSVSGTNAHLNGLGRLHNYGHLQLGLGNCLVG